MDLYAHMYKVFVAPFKACNSISVVEEGMQIDGKLKKEDALVAELFTAT